MSQVGHSTWITGVALGTRSVDLPVRLARKQVTVELIYLNILVGSTAGLTQRMTTPNPASTSALRVRQAVKGALVVSHRSRCQKVDSRWRTLFLVHCVRLLGMPGDYRRNERSRIS